MATAPKSMSFAEIQKRIREMDDERAELEFALQSKRGEELKVLADAYAKKLEAAGFTITEGVEALAPYDKAAGKKKRAPRGSVSKEAKPYVKGTVYKDPKSAATWTGGTKGRQPPWLIAALEGASDKAKAYAKLATGGDLVNNG
ncbi:hypothetical protein ACSFBX_22280 [Variovorax sp. RB2P76]|uniref:hypothetical protein n=1 Tax=Variovorax sp. RB2P76 TaxID=3443736 RepID=UPI003F45AC39